MAEVERRGGAGAGVRRRIRGVAAEGERRARANARHTLQSFQAAVLTLAITTSRDRHMIKHSKRPINDPDTADAALEGLLAQRDNTTDPLSHPLSPTFQAALTHAETEAYT